MLSLPILIVRSKLTLSKHGASSLMVVATKSDTSLCVTELEPDSLLYLIMVVLRFAHQISEHVELVPHVLETKLKPKR